MANLDPECRPAAPLAIGSALSRALLGFGLVALLLGVSARKACVGGEPALLIRGDGTYENAIAWQFESSAAPDYGAFAVPFPEALVSWISAVVLDLTGAPPIGSAPAGPAINRLGIADVFVWDDTDGVPGAVLWTETGVSLELDVTWPSFVRVVVPVDPVVRCDAITGDAAWAGFWGNWPGEPAATFVGTDLNGFGPAGMTRIAPGLGFPSGWQDVSIAWGGVTALGIGILAEPCGPEPVLRSSWGAIKRLYAYGSSPHPTKRGRFS